MTKYLSVLSVALTVFFVCPSCNSSDAQQNAPFDVYQTLGEAAQTQTFELDSFPGEENVNYATDILTGAQLIDEYLPMLEGKRVCILSNQCGIVAPGIHVLDTLLSLGVNVTCIMSPEHGFRGDADAGEAVGNSVDPKTGVPIKSLYGNKDKTPVSQTMGMFDILLFDLQDVGVRFYTYYVTMVNMMATCAEYDKEFIILDRPNPIGFYVDGPILDMKYKSGVGGLPIPTVHGMTLGELATMANGEGWLKGGVKCDLKVVKCKNYTHAKLYRLPLKPLTQSARHAFYLPLSLYMLLRGDSGKSWKGNRQGIPDVRSSQHERL